MVHKLLPDHNIMERIQVMQANASRIIERYEYEKPLEDEEIQQLQAEFSQNAIDEQRLILEKKKIVEELNEEIKKLQKASRPILQKIKTRKETVVEKVFVLEDDSTGEFGTYNAEGLLLAVEKGKSGDIRALKFDKVMDLGSDVAKVG
jgi:phosphomevalonate kinase